MDTFILFAQASIWIAVICAGVVLSDLLFRSPQKMWIMNVVWVITPLYSGPLGLWAYFRWGRLSSKVAVRLAKEKGEPPPNMRKPFWQMTAVGAMHCGSVSLP